MSVIQGFELPDFFPQPKVIEVGDSESTLAADVRLSTRNVLPIQRKAVRSILTAAGVRVVANKKTYVVDASVEEPSTFDLSKVPEAVRSEYYELEIRGSEVFIRSPYQNGMVWAAQTLALLFRQLLNGKKVPNLIIRDWPELPVRGMLLEGNWGLDRMTMYDWCQALDNMSALKLNTLCVGMYDCLPANRYQGDNIPAEFLHFPFIAKEGEDPYQPKYRQRWYHAGGDFWRDETYVSPLVQKNLLPEIITYAKEHGVNIVPVFSMLGRNSLFPHLFPKISAVDSRGKATGMGFCTSSPETREFLESMFSDFLTRFYPGGLDYVHLRFDEPKTDFPYPQSPLKKEKPWCRCKACTALSEEERVADYLIWLCGVLVAKGVQKVVIWHDYFSRLPEMLSHKFANRLAKAGLKDRLVLHYLDVNGSAEDCLSWNPDTAKAICKEQWLGTVFCHSDLRWYERTNAEVDKAMRLAVSAGHANGVVALSTGDITHLDQQAIVACHAWEPSNALTRDKIEKRWAKQVFGAGAEAYLSTLDKFGKAAKEPAAAVLTQLQYCESDGSKTWPRPYPEEALQRLEKMDGAQKKLLASAKQASQSAVELRKLLNNDKLSAIAKESLNSLVAEALRFDIACRIFACFLDIRASLADGSVKKTQLASCEELRTELVAVIKQYEILKPAWAVPHVLQTMSYVLLFLDQLNAELKNAASRKKNAAVSWSLPGDWKVPAN